MRFVSESWQWYSSFISNSKRSMCRYVLEERDCCHFHKGAKIIFHNSLESTISYYHKGDMITRLDYHGKRQRLNIGGNWKWGWGRFMGSRRTTALWFDWIILMGGLENMDKCNLLKPGWDGPYYQIFPSLPEDAGRIREVTAARCNLYRSERFVQTIPRLWYHFWRRVVPIAEVGQVSYPNASVGKGPSVDYHSVSLSTEESVVLSRKHRTDLQLRDCTWCQARLLNHHVTVSFGYWLIMAARWLEARFAGMWELSRRI